MRKRSLLLVITLVFSISLMLGGCSATKKSGGTATLEEVLEGTDLIPIPGEDNLVYYKNGKTVYIIGNYYATMSYQSGIFMSPLIIHGNYCEYIDGEIVEVTD